MPFDDPLQEFVTKEVALNNIIAPPEETEFRKQRTAEEAARPKFKTEKLPYITYDDVTTEGDLYDPLDFPTVSQKIRDNVLKAIVSRFPVSGERYTVKVENPHYETPRNTRKREERDAILRQESITDRLRGDLVLIDNATGNEVQRKTMTLVNVPRMTERGTFIRNGAFIGMKHMFRLRPGVYTRIKNNGIIQSHINPKQGTGRQMAIELDPESGVLALHRAGRQYGLLPLLEAAGMPEEEIRQSWGDELLHMNKEKYKQLFVAGSKKMEEYKRLWNDDIKPMLLDKETTQWTLGTPYESVQPRTLLQASNKMLRVARSAGDPDAPDETDDRDGLQYQTVLGPADYIAERILRDGGGLLRNTLNQITREGNLDKVQPGLFQPHVDSVFLDDGHTGYIDESSPLEAIYFNSGVSRLGEGGIGDTRAAPAESRGVQNSYVGFVDVIQSPESLKVGLDNYLVQGVRKDDKGKLYTKMRFPDGRVKYVDMATTANSIYTTPEYFNPEADPNERIPAFVRGKSVEWVPRKDVNMYVADTSNMMSVSAGTVPMVGGIRSNRVLMGSKYGIQALPLAQREAPLVRRAYTDDDGNPTTAEKALGRSMGARFSPVDGTVVSVDPDEIVIKDAAGQKHSIDLYNNYVLNQKGFLQNTPEVQKGDQVKANQLVASSNYTDKDGNAALGVNLRMAFMTGKDATTFEDSILVAESVAKTKLASMQMYKTRGDATPDIEYNKDRFIRSFGRQEFTKEQLDKLGEDGIALEGAVLQKGDPIFLGVKTQEQSTKGLSRNATVPYVETWEHDYPGTVRTIAHGRKHFMAYIDAATPMETGDKLCFDDKTEVFTDHGWRLFKDIQIDDRILTLDPKNGSTFLTDFRTLYEIRHKGRMYSLVTPDLDICVTENHNHLVTVNTNCMYMKFVQSDELFGLPYYHFIGMDHDFGKPRFYKCTQCKGSKERWVQYDGYVYCLEIPETHTLYVRRNGKCVWSGNSNKYGAKGCVRCYTKDYEIFTKNGFKKFSELTYDDEVAALDPVTNVAHFEHPSNIISREHDGLVYGYEDRNLSWCVTPEHDMWTRRYHNCHIRHPEDAYFARHNITEVHGGRWQHRVAAPFEDGRKDICTRVTLENKARTEYNKKKAIVDFDVVDFAAFLGLWLSEGSLSHKDKDARGEYQYAVITQKYDPNDPVSVDRCTKIEDAITRLGLKFSHSGLKYSISNRSLSVYLQQFGHSQDKYLPEEVFETWPEEAQRTLIEYMFLGDGDSCYTNSRRYMTSSYRLAQDFQRLCTLLGYRTSIHTQIREPDKRTGKPHCPIYRISFSDTEFSVSKNTSLRKDNPGYYTKQYKGMVYCCTVSTGIILVQHNGKPMWCGNCVPDDQMPVDEQGNMIEVLQSPLGLPSRVNTAQVVEAQEGKIARLTGQPVELPDFTNENLIDRTLNRLAEHGLKESETLYDPATGKHIPDVETGVMFYYKLKHMSDSKQGARGLGSYTAEEVPTKGGKEGSRRFGGLEIGALLGGGGDELVRDAKLVRGQQNDEFWRSYMSGEIPDAPRTPLVHRKFFNHLRAAGVSITPNQGKLHIYGASAADVDKLTAGRQVTNSSTFDAKQMRPIKGGLFDPSIFGPDGDQWAYYELPEPVLNPLMFKPVAHMLGWKDKELEGLLRGERHVNNKVGIEALQDILSKVDLPRELRAAKAILKDPNAPLAKHDAALKKVRAIEPMIRENKKPADMLWTKLPILPPAYRQVSSLADDVNIVADANFLYKRVMDAADDLKEAKQVLPKEALMDARTSMYNAVDELVGLSEPGDPKLQAKNVGGLLKWAFGKGSPKLSSLHRKVFGATVDLGGRGTVVPDNSLSIDEIGVPEKTAWKLYEPQVVRRLRQRGFSMLDAIRNVTDRTPEARRILDGVMKDMPVLMNRAPTLWEYGIRGFYPKIVEGNATHVNPNIVSPFGMDFDGDSVWNLVYIVVTSKNFSSILQKSLDEPLISSEKAVYCTLDTSNNTEREGTMLKQGSKIYELNNLTIAIEDIPVTGTSMLTLEGSEEWTVPDGIYVHTIDRKTGQAILAPVTHKSLHKNVRMLDVVTEVAGSYTQVITCSEDKSLVAYDNNGELSLMTPEEVMGHPVPYLVALDAANTQAHCTKYIRIGTQQTLTFNLGVFMGAILGDGWVDTQDTAWIAAEHPDIQNKLIDIIKNKLNLPQTETGVHLYEYHTERFGSSDAHRIHCGIPRSAGRELRELIGAGAKNKKIPVECMHASRAHLVGLLVGLLATDGSIHCGTKGSGKKKAVQKSIIMHTISPLLRDGIQQICKQLGVRTSATPYKGVNSLETCYAITFSLTDIAKLYREEPNFRMLDHTDQENLEHIVELIETSTTPNSFDLVPFPRHLRSEFAYAGIGGTPKKYLILRSPEVTYYDQRGSIARSIAKQLVDVLRKVDWSHYEQNTHIAKEKRTYHTPEQAKKMVEDWCRIVDDESIAWKNVISVTEAGTMDAWDLTVPGPFTFALADGTVVQDTAALHVPVTKQAIQKVKEKMLPSRSLLSPQFNQVHYYPEAEFLQGLNLATREGTGKPVHFRTEEEMMAALKRGEITYDTAIEIG